MADPKLTDLGNRDRFVEAHACRLRFVGKWRKWLGWDGTRWRLDHRGSASRLAGETVHDMYREAAAEIREVLDAIERASASGDEALVAIQKERLAGPKSRLAWALKSHEGRRINTIVDLARSAAGFVIDSEELDMDPWLLNVMNGTLDLRSGELRPHRPEDLITKVTAAPYDPAACCPLWEAFIERVFAGDTDLIAFLQRMAGYALTGVTTEQVLSFFYGEGANGKSTILTAFRMTVGEYATHAPRHLLFSSRGQRHETELTTLFGARLVTCAEIDVDAVFDEALVKDLTGGDAITARRMREDHWTFEPTHKLFLAGNHKPRVRGNDEGIWRRLLVVPFTQVIPPEERDHELLTKLAAERAGILAWMVRGCMVWQRDGLRPPSAVTDATTAYRVESDPLREFFDLHCIFEDDARIARQSLRFEYETYCAENGAEPLGAKRFAEALRRRGVGGGSVREKGTGIIKDGWKGIRLATTAERVQKAQA